jgi:hypothetical protein
LRRTSRPFITEVKRRHGRSIVVADWAVGKEPPSATTPLQSFVVGAIEKREAAQLLEHVFEKAPAPPTGRILPSLVESGSPSEAEPQPGPPKHSRQTKASKSARSSKPDVATNDPRPVALGYLQEAPLITVIGEHSASTTRTKATPRLQLSLENVATVQQTDAPVATQPPLIDLGSEAAASRKRPRSIAARYVFGTEPKLGERWKLRLRKNHRR